MHKPGNKVPKSLLLGAAFLLYSFSFAFGAETPNSKPVHVTALNERVLLAEDGLLLGNGDLSVSVYQTVDRIVFRFGKGDVWDRRLDLSDDPKPAHISEIAHGIEVEHWKCGPYGGPVEALNGTKDEKRMKELCQGAPPSYVTRPYPCPKPVGELAMQLPARPQGSPAPPAALHRGGPHSDRVFLAFGRGDEHRGLRSPQCERPGGGLESEELDAPSPPWQWRAARLVLALPVGRPDDSILCLAVLWRLPPRGLPRHPEPQGHTAARPGGQTTRRSVADRTTIPAGAHFQGRVQVSSGPLQQGTASRTGGYERDRRSPSAPDAYGGQGRRHIGRRRDLEQRSWRA